MLVLSPPALHSMGMGASPTRLTKPLSRTLSQLSKERRQNLVACHLSPLSLSLLPLGKSTECRNEHAQILTLYLRGKIREAHTERPGINENSEVT